MSPTPQNCFDPNCVCRRSTLNDKPSFIRCISPLWWIPAIIALLIVLFFVTPKANAQCDLDFNNDGEVSQADIDAFLRVSSEGPCYVLNDGTEDTLAPQCDSIDFNGDGSLFDPQDFEQFAAAFAGGPCPDGWYPVPKWHDQVRIWLAPSYGSDSNSGYKREQAVATSVKAYMLVQEAAYANRPWAVLIPRGEVVRDQFIITPDGNVVHGGILGQYGAWAHSGSGGKPGYIAADPNDDPSLPRPKIIAYGAGGGGSGFRGYCGNVRIISLEFEGNGIGDGVCFIGKGSDGRNDIVVSDVLVKSFAGGFAFKSESKADPMKRVVVSRSASKWCYNAAGHGQGSFASCVDGMVWDTVTLLQNGWNEQQGDPRDVYCHNYYGVSNSENVRWINSVSVEAAATNWQFRGGKQDADGCVSINGPLGVTFGHAQAEADDDAAGSLTNSLVIGGGNIGPEPRSLSIGVNRAAGVRVTNNIIWRDPVEGIAMNTGAAFWLQGAGPNGAHQTWDISSNIIYEPRYNPQGQSLAPIVRDDRAAGSVPSAAAILEDNTILTAIPSDWTQPPSISDYLDRYDVHPTFPQWAGRTFGEMASRNRRGAWRDEFTAQKLIEYWWAGMRPPE